MSPTVASESLQHDVKLKMLLIGDSCKLFLPTMLENFANQYLCEYLSVVGKTCIMRKYSSGSYVPIKVKTIGLDLLIKMEVVDSTRVQLQV